MTRHPPPASEPPRILLPVAPALVAGLGRAVILTTDGELLDEPVRRAAELLADMPPPLLLHAPATWRRLGCPPHGAYDLLELFLFVHPGRPAAPTPLGLARALGLEASTATLADAAALLPKLATELLRRLAAGRATPQNRDAASLAARMGQAGWSWARPVQAALGEPAAAPHADSLRVWRRLPEWQEAAPPPPPKQHPVSGGDARRRLAALLGPDAEQRPGQADYAAAAAMAFAPREQRGEPALVLAEAGTGTGKTLGYVAPSSLWAERNGAPVWVSTYTKHLQRQIQAELARLVPDPLERARRVVLRKGRENYLCLLNFEDAVTAAAGGMGQAAVAPLALVARWALASADGDLFGGDLPGWFAELFGSGLAAGLADRRGECLHAGCPHYRRCFVEHTIRRARTADLVVANHALVMGQAAWGGLDDGVLPTRYVFDEGHHVFEAADGAFAAEFSGMEAAELRRWLLGSEGSRARGRGLRVRLAELVVDRPALEAPLDAALTAARALPPPGWSQRLGDRAAHYGPEAVGAEPGRPNPSEAFLHALRRQVLARLPGDAEPGPGTLECDLRPLAPDLPDLAETLDRALARIEAPLVTLAQRLQGLLADEAEELDEAARNRIEAACRTLKRRAIDRLRAWRQMLHDLGDAPPEPGRRGDFVTFLVLDRREAGDRDVALVRHWLDPTVPLAATLLRPAHGVLVTSATLRDAGEPDPELAWETAEAQVGALHMARPAVRVAVGSPFDYAAQTRAFVVTDLPFGDIGALAGAFRALFEASDGGALGLFTAIARLRAVHARIAAPLEAAGIPLLAQHVDAMGNASLVDIFRTEERSCLLGTDAMRDGVDVPGRSLRLVVFERVPWPRPDILHRERRVHLSGGDPKGFDDRLVRHRLRQAFGRLIRTATDRGVFVLLDRQTPSRLLTALPQGVAVRRVGLAEAAAGVRTFLG